MSIENAIVIVVIALAVGVAGWKLYRVLMRKESPCGSCSEYGGCPFESGSRSCSVEYPYQCPKNPDSDEEKPFDKLRVRKRRRGIKNNLDRD